MSSFARVFSAQPHNLKGHIVTVELDISRGLHSFSIVGLPDKAVEEARDRVSSAIKNSGFTSPKQKNEKTVVSLAPAEIKKEGSFFDLAIAVGYLLSSGDLHFDPNGKIFLGELSLNGELKPIRGALPLAQAAAKAGFAELFLPVENAREAALVPNLTIYPARTLREVIDHLDPSDEPIKNRCIVAQPPTRVDFKQTSAVSICFSDVRGQETAKRGLEIAAAGGHNIAMYGPPGTGKTMLAKAFITILPKLDQDDALEVTGIHSIAGNLDTEIIIQPPFRSPHHTSSYVSVIGGGATPKPGEVTLAHRGILFLDEFPEFDRRVIESLRQPLEDRVVHIARAKGTASFPTDFILIAAMNPPDPGASAAQIMRWKQKISGPIMDRIDMWFPVEHIDYEKLSDENFARGETSQTIQRRIISARQKQKERLSKWGSNKKLNNQMGVRELDKIGLSKEVKDVLNQSAAKLRLSPRSYHRVIKLAQTIADLDQSELINTGHILEALQYRPKELI